MQLAFIVCFATELFHGASSHLVPNAIVTTPIEEDRAVQKYKRDANAQRQCVSNRLDAIFQGNTSNFVSLCKSIAVGPQIDPSNPTSAQAQIIPIYRIYCISALLLMMHTEFVVFTAVFHLVVKHSMLVCVERMRMETNATNSMVMA